MTQLYLIRHGEAQSAVKHMIGDTDLTPLGVQQAERLRDRLAATHEIQADVLIASTFKRARQTAEIIAPALELPILFDDEVQEMRDGAANGMKIKDYIEKFGEVDFSKTPFRQVAPQGENWGQFMLRVCTSLDRITREYEGKTVVIVCHGGVIEGSILFFFGMNGLQIPQAGFETHNTSITAWEKKTSLYDKRSRWRLKFYNDDFHLRDLKSSVRIPWEGIAKPLEGAEQLAVPLENE